MRKYFVAITCICSNADGVVVSDNLFTAIDTVNPATPSVTADFWAAWTTTPGFPLVTVERNGTTLNMTQKRFMRLEEGNTKTERYNIPINIAIDSDDYANTTADFLFRLSESTMTYNLTTTPEKYYILNKQQTGFYRVNYDEENWNNIKEALMTEDHDNIHVLNRAQIVDDLFNLARAGIVEYGTALDIILYIKSEKSYIPWLSAFTCLTVLSLRVSGERNEELFKWFVLDLTDEIYNHLTFDELTSDVRTDRYNRATVQTWACKYGHEGCIERSTELFNNFMAAPTTAKVPKNQRSAVYCNAIRSGNETHFNFLFDRFATEDISAEQLLLLNGMACTKNETLLAVRPNVS